MSLDKQQTARVSRLGIRTGDRVGRYKITARVKEAATGGTSRLFAAQLAQVDGAQRVLLKSPSLEQGDRMLAFNALRREVDLLHRLRNPGIVNIYPIPSPKERKEHYISRATNVGGKPWFCVLEYLGGDRWKAACKS